MDSRSSERALRIFASLWALAVLLETARAFGDSGPLDLLLLLLTVRFAALWVLSRPGAAARFVLFNAAVAAFYVARLPQMNNHGVLILVASTSVVLAALRCKASNRRAPLTASELYASFAPLLRWELLAMYFWAVVHKLNADFLATDLSCGAMQVWNIHRWLPLLPTTAAVEQFGIYGTLGVEAAIPLLLLPGRTRLLGMLLAGGFHYVLGAGYPGFSAMLFALLSLFAPPSLFAALPGRSASAGRLPAPAPWRARLDAGLGAVAGALAALGLGALLLAPDAGLVGAGAPLLSKGAVAGLWLAYGAVLLGGFALALRRLRPWRAERHAIYRLRYPSLGLLPLLVFLNGMTPHLGIKNTLAFAMFSNLRTEGGTTNHLLLPASLQRWHALDDLVEIRSSSDPVLAKLVGPSWRSVTYFSTYIVGARRLAARRDPPKWRLPYLSLRRRVNDLARSGARNVRLTYERAGVVRSLDRAERDPELSRLSLLERKLLFLRAVPDGERGYCMW